ncbi:MAG: outer membrane protein assembly factor BamD [Acidobacteria bacterium]|nr:outer membrane protein assembly factor BamD [Acidobacteriota bacterium]
MRKLWFVCVLFTLLLFSAGCKKKVNDSLMKGQKEVPVSTIYQEGLSYLASGRYTRARSFFQLIIDNAPNSKEFADAKLGVADSEFFDLETGPAEALTDYQSFLVYFPKSKRAPYAQYMVGMCYYSQISSPDRDQSFSREAITAFEELRRKYPDSPYSKLSEEKIRLCWDRLAEHEFGVGVFYYKVHSYLSAAGRFQYLLDHYIQYLTKEGKEKTYYFYGRSLFEMTRYDEAARYYRLLLKEFPQTLYRDQVSSELAEIESGKLQREKEAKIKAFKEKMKEMREKELEREGKGHKRKKPVK